MSTPAWATRWLARYTFTFVTLCLAIIDLTLGFGELALLTQADRPMKWHGRMRLSTTPQLCQPTNGPHEHEPRLSVSGESLEALPSEAVRRRVLSRKERKVQGQAKSFNFPFVPSSPIRSRSTARRQLASVVAVCASSAHYLRLPRILLYRHRRSCRHVCLVPGPLRGDLSVQRLRMCSPCRRTSNLHPSSTRTPGTFRLSRGRAA